MSTPEPRRLSEEEVRKVAKLARLELGPEQVELYSEQLSSVLEHIENLQGMEVDSVEPMAHPLPLSNRLAEDVPGEALPLEAVLANAPRREGDFIAVPKVLGEGS